MNLSDILKETVSRRKRKLEDAEEVISKKQKTSKKFVFLTWNVWFEESVQVIKRIEAIGNFIVCHDCDVVALQEVTMNILKLLWASDWYQQGQWHCSLPTDKPVSAPYFAIILSKTAFKGKPRIAPFSNSIMGREIVSCKVEFEGRVLTVATTHLESPVGTWSGGRADLFSPQRRAQLKKGLELLAQESGDVIFGGDMNWTDSTVQKEWDGEAPLGTVWSDTWLHLQPVGEKGYTYDAKENQMLVGSLRKRLDRTFFKTSQDLLPQSIERIGCEPLDGVFYMKERKKKSKVYHQKLPVLPSDHFGLLSTWSF